MWKHICFTLAILIFISTACTPAQTPPTDTAIILPTITNTASPVPPTATSTATPTRPTPTNIPSTTTIPPTVTVTIEPSPTAEASPTAEVTPVPKVEITSTVKTSHTPKEMDFSGPVRVAEDFLKRRNSIVKAIKENGGKIPRNLPIPQEVFRLGDDPNTKNKEEGYYTNGIIMSEKDLYKIYVRQLGLPQDVYQDWLKNKTPNEAIEKVRERAFQLYLSPEDGPEEIFQGGLWNTDSWSLGPNETIILRPTGWTKRPVTQKDRDEYKKIIPDLMQPIIKPTRTPTVR